MTQTVNDHLLLVGGESATGKTASLMYLNDPGVIYFNCEAGKKLPFKSKFKEVTITDPMDVIDYFAQVETQPQIHTIVVDTLTYLMDMYESKYVLTAANGMKAWSEYAQYFKTLMQDAVAKSTKNVVFLAHTKKTLNASEMVEEVCVPIKGALKNNGVESYFSVVIATKKKLLKDLVGYENDLLTITEEDEMLGYKHVFQTRVTKDTMHERIRGPLGLWKHNETFIDNNLSSVLQRLQEYYSED